MTAEHTSPAAGGPDTWQMCLYVAGQSPRSLTAFANLTSLCERYLPGRYEIEVIDLLEEPARAQRDDIVALPTLVRRVPAPLRKIIGDLSNLDRVLAGLRLQAG